MPTEPAGSDLINAFVTSSGRLVAATADAEGISVSVTDDGRTWATQVPALGDSLGGSIPVTEVRVSHDDGGSWTRTRGLDTSGGDRVRDLSSVAVMPDGTTYLATGSHHLVRIGTGDNACLVTEAGRLDQMRCGASGGPWVAMPLPGLR